MRRIIPCLAILLSFSACKDDSSPPSSTGGPPATGQPATPSAGGSNFARALAERNKQPLTAADVERYLALAPDFAKATEVADMTAAAQAHGMTVQEAALLMGRVGSAYAGLQAKDRGLALPKGLNLQDVETVRPFADRIRAAMKKPK